MWRQMGRPLHQLGQGLARPTKPVFGKPRQLKMRTPRSLNYTKIKQQVLEVIATLSEEKRRLIPVSGTLPEQMAALGLVMAGIPFQTQIQTDGGRLRLGGAVVDFQVFLGAKTVILRVQGDYWHSLPDRKLKDVIQFDRLHKYRYLVADVHEGEMYQAWVDGRLQAYIEQAVMSAA